MGTNKWSCYAFYQPSSSSICSQQSSAGYLAIGLSGRNAHVLNIVDDPADPDHNWQKEKRPPCEEVRAAGACFKNPPKGKLKCGEMDELVGKDKGARILEKCQDDYKGLQLVPWKEV